MKIFTRLLISGAALAALLVPASQAGRRGVRILPRAVLPADSGTGAGSWIGPSPDAAVGFASARLFDASGRLRYAMRARLVGGSPGSETDEQGGFLGVLFAVDPNGVDASGARTPVGRVEGKWIRHVDGSGEFGVQILTRTGDPEIPLVAVGEIEGILHASPPRLALNWTISE